MSPKQTKCTKSFKVKVVEFVIDGTNDLLGAGIEHNDSDVENDVEECNELFGIQTVILYILLFTH